MTEVLTGFKRQSPGIYENRPIPARTDLLETTRLIIVRVFTDLLLVMLVIAIIHNLMAYHRPWRTLICFFIPLGLFFLFRCFLVRRVHWNDSLSWIFLILFYANFISGYFYWGWLVPAPAVICLPAVILTATLLEVSGGWLSAVGVGLCWLVYLVYYFSPAPRTLLETKLLLTLMLLTPVVLAAGWAFWRLRGKLTRELETQNENYRRSLNVRRRLLGTLLHDLANPLTALQLHLTLQSTSADVSQVRDLNRRMLNILKNSRDLLDSEDQASPNRLGHMGWGTLVERIRQVFGGRLEQKGMTLRLQGDPDLRFICLPDVLCDSVMANLVSNALKFSNRGGTIEITCAAAGAQVRIRVADRGPGIPEGQLDDFRKGRHLKSGTGSEGEQGTGLGLLLARDYTRFMGGELDLGVREGGGTEANLRLRKYDP